MSNDDKFAADFCWLPHRLDPATNRVQLLKLPRERFSAAEFLADHIPATDADIAHLSAEEFANATVAGGPVHFIFHTAFCRSTLFARAMGSLGDAAALSEPGILANLAGHGDKAAHLIEPAMRWLSRPHSDGGTVFVKPTNHANQLIPAVMKACPNARAMIMSNALPDFLRAVNKRGLLGRQWARKLYLEVQQYAPLDLGLDGTEQFALTDMQAAGLAWLLQRRWLLMMIDHLGARRFASLDSGAFNSQPAQSMIAAARLTGLECSEAEAEGIAGSPLFTSHAKLGGDFRAREADEAARTNSAIWDEEAAQVEQWIGLIAEQAGLPRLLPQPLL